MIPTLLKAAAAAVGVIIAMFFFTYLPQVAVLAVVSGPLGKSSVCFPQKLPCQK